MTKIALSAGHHNLTGGNHTEIELVGPLTKALAAHCREQGFDVRVVTPNNGLGTFPGGLRAVAQRVVDWAGSGWKADIFLEVHAEYNRAGNAGRGCFVIYPDAEGDTDTIVRDQLGLEIARSIRDTTGISVRGSGLLSERHTHVWLSQRARLGIFEVTRSLRSHCRRMIVEVGAYSSPLDLAIMRRPDFPNRCGWAIADALADHVRPKVRWFEVIVEAARTREGPGTQHAPALQGEATLRRGDVFAVDEIVPGEVISGNPNWVHRADQIGFVSMALVKEVRV